jgi:signal transduction histidine kinase
MEAITSLNIRHLFHEHGTEVVLEPCESLFRQGEASDAVYYVLSGALVAYAGTGETDPVLLNCVKAENLVGELGAITQNPRTATLVATSRSVLSRIPAPQFRALLTETLSLVETMVSNTRGNLVSADTARIRLGNTYKQAQKRVSQLGEEKEQLQELLRLREELAAMVMHDLRNPLNAVMTVLDMMELRQHQVQDPEENTLLIGMAKTAARSMTRLIDTLLDIGRLEAGKLALNIEPFDLAATLGELAAGQQMQVMHNAVRIVLEAPPSLMVKADRNVLLRVVVNLLDNAIKFAPDQSEIGIRAGSERDGSVHISVTDAGPGIPAGDRERIFEKFTQVNDARHRARGSGLGLTFCRMAVEAHGGTIGVEAGPSGTGSRFHVRLPQG